MPGGIANLLLFHTFVALMWDRSFFRAFMVVVGISATMAIVLSQALPGQPTKKAKTEQSEQDTDLKIISAPSDVVPGAAVQVNDADRFLLEVFVNEGPKAVEFECDAHILSGYLSVLFGAIISPNAP